MGRARRQKWLARALRIATLRRGKKGRRPSVADASLADVLTSRFNHPQLQQAMAQVVGRG